MCSSDLSFELFRGLKRIVIDEVHAFATGKRGDLLALALTRLQAIAPDMQRAALSATLANPQGFREWLAPWGEIEGAPDEAARVAAERVEAEYDTARLKALIDNNGRE